MDDQLIAAYLAGDESAFTTLYERYAGLLHKRARNLLPSHLQYLAEDVVQVAMSRVPRYRPKGDRPFRMWLFTVLRNAAYMAIKRQSKHHAHRAEFFDKNGDACFEPRCYQKREFSRTIDGLPEQDREIMRQVHLFGRTFVEVAVELGMTRNSVSQRYRRVLERLRAA